MRPRYRALRLIFSLLFVCVKIHGERATWNASGGGVWTDDHNWECLPGPHDIATFGPSAKGTATVHIPTVVDIGTIEFTGGEGYTVLGGTINAYKGLSITGKSGSPRHAIASDIHLHSTIAINQDNEAGVFILSGDIVGRFGIVKEGLGRVVLSGANTYDGGTTIGSGIVQIFSNDGLGDPSTSVTFTGGTLRTAATFSSPRIMNLAKDGAINVAPGTTFTALGPVINRGSLTKLDSGTLILKRENTYSGGTIISNGAIQVESDGNLGDPSGSIIFAGLRTALHTTASFHSARRIQLDSDATFNTAANTTLTLSGLITGKSGFTKRGRGRLILQESNTYQGNIFISAGTLQGSTASLRGDITNNAALIFDQPTNSTYSGSMSGSGSLVKTGAGTLIVTNKNSSTGPIRIEAGTLEVAPSATLGEQNDLHITSGSLTIKGVDTSVGSLSGHGNITLTHNATLTATQKKSTAFSGILSGGHFVKKGTAQLILAGPNTHTGSTTIQEGRLTIAADQNLGEPDAPLIFKGGELRVVSRLATSRPVTLSENAPIFLNDSAYLTLSGRISGSGGLIQQGTGTLALHSINTYRGGTTVSGGLLRIADERALGNPNAPLAIHNATLQTTTTSTMNKHIEITSKASLETQPKTVLTLLGGISGIGHLRKQGSGTLVLPNSNTYKGPTTIAYGTIKLNSDAALGEGGPIHFINGTLAFTNSTTSHRPITISQEATFDIAPEAAVTLLGPISGSGTLKHRGTGTLILANHNNTYSGGLSIARGTVRGDSSNLRGDIANNGFLIFDQKTPGTHSGSITGQGTIIKAGEATLTLTDMSASRRTIFVQEGTLRGTTESIRGRVINNSSLTFDQGHDGAYTEIMRGTGSLTKTGSGRVTLQQANFYTGPTTIKQGDLRIMRIIPTEVTIEAGGRLSGTGAVYSTYNKGTVSPGASIGTLTINGDYTQAPNATLIIEVDQTGRSDLLRTLGTATLDGALHITPNPGIYIAGTRYTIVSATDLTGAFASFPSWIALSYSNTKAFATVTLSWAVLPVPLSQLKGNAKRVAKYLFCDDFTPTGDLLTVLQKLTQVPAAQFPLDLTQLIPAQFGALPLVNFQNDTRIATTFVEYAEKHSRCRPDKGHSVWVQPLGYYYRQNGMDEQVPFNAHTFGTAFGTSHTFGKAGTISAGGGYTHSRLRWKQHRGEGSWDSVYLVPSIGWVPRTFYLNGLALFSANFYTIDRSISFSDVRRTAHNTHSSYDILVRGDAGGKFRINNSGFCLQPEFRLSYLNIFEAGYTESGAKSLNLDIESKHSAFLQPEFTLKWLKEWRKGSRCFSPSLYLGWQKTAALLNGSYTSKLNGQETCKPNFTVKSFHQSTDQLIVGAEIVASTARSLFTLEYEANVGSGYQVQEGKVRFEWAF